MSLYDKTKDIVLKLQDLPEEQRKTIFFAVISVAAVIMALFLILSAEKSISKIAGSAKSINLPNIAANQPNFQLNATGNEAALPSSSIDNFASSQQGVVLNTQYDNWQTYKNNAYKFELKYPGGWNLDEKQATDLDTRIEKVVSSDVADIHIEVASQTQKTKSTEDGIKYIVSQMKDIIKPAQKITAGKYEGYEVIGNICTGTCKGSANDPYFPFSVIYFSNKNTVIKIKYAEGQLGKGWAKDIKDWKYYDEFKNIISTFNFTG